MLATRVRVRNALLRRADHTRAVATRRLATSAACSDARGARGGRCGAAVRDGAVAAHDVVDGRVLVVRVEQVVGVAGRRRERVQSAELRRPALEKLEPRARRVEQRALVGIPLAVGAADALAGRRAAR